MKVIERENHSVYSLAGLGSTFGMGDNPQSGESLIGNSVAAALRPLLELDRVAQQVKTDKFLSDEGKADKLTSARARVVDEVAKQRKLLEAETGQVKADESALFAAPKLDPTDAVGGLLDRERRDHFRGLSRDQQTHLQTQMGGGQHPELLHALLRDPMPGLGREIAQGQWRASIEAKHPKKVQVLETRKNALAWAATAFNGMEYAATRRNS
jgi:hypothetical protein